MILAHATITPPMQFWCKVFSIYTVIKLENIKGTIKKGQSRETGSIGYTRQRKTKHNKMCVGHHYTQTNTNNIIKTCHVPLSNRGREKFKDI